MRRDFKNQSVIVVGAGRTGLALCAYFARRQARVTLSDRRCRENLDGLDALQRAGVAFDLGGHTLELFLAADLVVVSPGVPLTIAAIAEAAAEGIPVLGEIEIAFAESEAPLVAITGTNGKSTTTTVMGEIFSAWGKKTFVGGNLGTPLIEAVDLDRWDWIVAELSSFQLEAIESFRPRYALLLNISEDHLDRYPDMQSYVAAKRRMFENMTAGDVMILNDNDPAVLRAAKGCPARAVHFSSRRVLEEGMGFDGSHIVWRHAGVCRRFPADQLRLKGLHNIENVMAAMIPPLLEGVPHQTVWAAAAGFAGLPHRMTEVRVLDGVAWYNDSKGTNVGSVVKSLAGLQAPVTLIAGGKDKGGDYLPLVEPVREKVAHLVLIGEAAEKMAGIFSDAADVVRAASLEEAVGVARELTPKGGAVLFSPGCSSFDMFRSFEERGDVFTRAVMALEPGGNA